jgi:hypothetical protein
MVVRKEWKPRNAGYPIPSCQGPQGLGEEDLGFLVHTTGKVAPGFFPGRLEKGGEIEDRGR